MGRRQKAASALLAPAYDLQPAALELAGAEGFEPPNGGIKTRCLTTWLRPKNSCNSTVVPGTLRARSALLRLLREPIEQRRAIHTANDESRPTRRELRQNGPGGLLVRHGYEYARTRASQAGRTESSKPIKRFGDFRIAPAHGRRAIVATTPREKGAYCRDRRIACQFRSLKDLRRAHICLRFDDEVHVFRKVLRRNLLTDALHPRGAPAHEHGHIGAKAQP